ncbi:MAG TPA: ATP-dependent DNA helicase RecQ, partial [Aeromonadales bacterium]|nr:ATP-dependent DNA helicase RecQ [Aeromonadales bacterium]
TIFRQLIALGIIDIDAERHGALRLTQKSRAILKGDQKLFLRKLSVASTTTAPNKKPKSDVKIKPQDEPLWQALRDIRHKLAEEHGVPAFVVFHDSTLRDMVKYRPQTLEQMLTISGIGEQKLQRFGQKFLEIIKQFPVTALLQNNLSDTINRTLILFEQGLSIDEIALERELKTTSIYSHLADTIAAGYLQIDEVIKLPAVEYQTIIQTMETLEGEQQGKLKPVFDALDEKYDYGILQCVKASIAAL